MNIERSIECVRCRKFADIEIEVEGTTIKFCEKCYKGLQRFTTRFLAK